MKSLGGEGNAVKKRVVRVEDALRYAMSLPVATTISGIDSMRVLSQNVRIASGFQPLSRCTDGADPSPRCAPRRRRPLRAV